MKQILPYAAALAVLVAAPAVRAADLPVPVYKAPVVAVPLPYSWTGFYVGGNVGYSWGRGNTDFSDTTTTTFTEFRGVTPCVVPGIPCGGGPLPPGFGATTTGGASGVANIDGWLGGLQAGYNWQYNTWVYGLEGDIQLTSQRGSVTLCDTAGCPVGAFIGTASYKLPWFATFRGRVGVTPSPKWLLYLTGGLAVAEVDADYSGGPVGLPGAFTGSNHSVRFGWVLGGGIEAAIADTNWRFKVEYLYMDLGSISSGGLSSTSTQTLTNFPSNGFNVVSVLTTTGAFNTRVTDNILRVGLNYRFSATDPVVVRKY